MYKVDMNLWAAYLMPKIKGKVQQSVPLIRKQIQRHTEKKKKKKKKKGNNGAFWTS
jgi:hypothetical protein